MGRFGWDAISSSIDLTKGPGERFVRYPVPAPPNTLARMLPEMLWLATPTGLYELRSGDRFYEDRRYSHNPDDPLEPQQQQHRIEW